MVSCSGQYGDKNSDEIEYHTTINDQMPELNLYNPDNEDLKNNAIYLLLSFGLSLGSYVCHAGNPGTWTLYRHKNVPK